MGPGEGGGGRCGFCLCGLLWSLLSWEVGGGRAPFGIRVEVMCYLVSCGGHVYGGALSSSDCSGHWRLHSGPRANGKFGGWS